MNIKLILITLALFSGLLFAVYHMGRLSERAQANAEIAVAQDKVRKSHAEWKLRWAKRDKEIKKQWRKSDVKIRRLIAKNHTLQSCRLVDLGPELTDAFWMRDKSGFRLWQ